MRPPQSAPGFTLLEMLVALTIMSAGVALLFAIMGKTLTRDRDIQSRMAARVLAVRLLNQAETAPDVRFGQRSGTGEGGLSWTLDVAPYGGDEDVQAWPAAAAALTAKVRWGREPTQSLALSSLRLVPKEQRP
ncbi:MAG: type II secretion system protein [Alphaproteobacteria bacterium]|nr:type II secretion system protein [Alphaproteobacteria bacterium]MBV9693543.1 type II secretion system protein [Alphaproteobacteria bacterium]